MDLFLSLCLYGSSSTIGTSIWVRSLRHEGNVKSLLSSQTHMAMPPNGTDGGSWSEARAEPTPLCVLPLALELAEGQVWLCTWSRRPWLWWQLAGLASRTLDASNHIFQTVSENTYFDSSTDVLHHLILFTFVPVCVFKSHLPLLLL